MASRNRPLRRLDARLFVLLLAGMAIPALADDLPPTVLQLEFREALTQAARFEQAYPVLGAALEGTPGPIDASRNQFLALPVDQPATGALGNLALSLAEEKASPGAGIPLVREATLRAGTDLGLQWYLVLTQLHRGSPEAFQRQFDGLEAAMLTQGWQRLPEVASWLLASAADFDRDGKGEAARLAREAAERIDPVSPVPPWSQAVRSIASLRLDQAYMQLAEAGRRLLSYPSAQQVFVFNVLRLLRYALALTFLFLLVAWLFRYWPWITHHLAERLPRDTNLGLRYVVIAIALVALLVAGLGVLSMCFLACALLWKQAKRYERSLLGIIILYVGAQPFWVGVEGALSQRFDLAGAPALYQRTVEEGWSQDLQDRIDRGLGETSLPEEKPLLIGARSVLERKRGLYSSAIADGEAAWKLAPGDFRNLVNMGNLRFLTAQYNEAETFYRQAMALESENGPLLYNLGQSASYRGHTDSTAFLFRSAAPLARYRVDVVANQNGRHFQALPSNRLVMDPEPGALATWKAIFDDLAQGRWSVSSWDLRTGVFDLPPLVLPWASLALLIGLVVWGRQRPKRKTLFVCKTCGRVMCQHCRKGLHCTQCFRRLSGVEEIDTRNDLFERIEQEKLNKERLLHLGLDMALPGTGRLMTRPGFLGFLQVGLLAVTLSYALNLPNFLSIYPVSETMAGRPVALTILAILYGWSAIQLVRRSGRLALPAGDA